MDPVPPSPPAPPPNPSSSLFLALVGALAGGGTQLVLPTATLLEVIGNAVMGALVVGVIDHLLVRATLKDRQLRTGRILLVLFVSFTLALVTYRPPALVFQTVFNTAPPPGVRDVAAQAYTNQHLGKIGYRLSFFADPIGLNHIRERMVPLAERAGSTMTQYDPTTPWPAFLDRHMAAGSPLRKAADAMESPEAQVWTSPTSNGHEARTVLVRDGKSGLTLVEHTAG